MPKLPFLTFDPAWIKLSSIFESMKPTNGLDMREFFEKDPQRLSKFSISVDLPDPDDGGPLYIDFSKNLIDSEILANLFDLARNRKVGDKIEGMFQGQKINSTEGRAVLHTALRAHLADPPIICDGVNILPQITKVLSDMEEFTNAIHVGKWTGYSGKKMTDVVNIGIGGSDLGPKMVCKALSQYKQGLKCHFVSNVDESHLVNVLEKVDPETTLFIVASKTFTTQETLANAHSARKWFLSHAKDEKAIAKHFVALSTNLEKVQEFGISKSFEFWDFVGGRYSLWSAIGLSIALSVGFGNFRKLLDGARFMDQHFRTTPLEKNIPVILAVIGVWYNSIMGLETHAILPYDQNLSKLPAYLQQADMESNGKSVTLSGVRIKDYNTGPIIWGAAGTNGQHAFYQLLHQGTRIVPADFIGFTNKSEVIKGISHHSILFANFIAQPEALMKGKLSLPATIPADLKPHKIFEGNRPSNIILAKQLTPFTLGCLIAMYEHKIFVQGVIWDINSFDQWGVELGKELAKLIEPELANGPTGAHDQSTNGLINEYYSKCN